jgi:hypothetical protein
MIEEAQIEAIVEERIAAAIADLKPSTLTMMAIRPFNAWDDDDHPVQVVGISMVNEEMEFVAITERCGEFFPTLVGAVYKGAPNAQKT